MLPRYVQTSVQRYVSVNCVHFLLIFSVHSLFILKNLQILFKIFNLKKERVTVRNAFVISWFAGNQVEFNCTKGKRDAPSRLDRNEFIEGVKHRFGRELFGRRWSFT